MISAASAKGGGVVQDTPRRGGAEAKRQEGTDHTRGVTPASRNVRKSTKKVESLYAAGQPATLPADAAGPAMRALNAEANKRLLGNGYCGRPAELDCRYETISESCTFFFTTIEYRPTIQAQRDDADAKGKPDDETCTTTSSEDSTTPRLDTDHPHKPRRPSRSSSLFAAQQPPASTASARPTTRSLCQMATPIGCPGTGINS